MKPPRLSLRLLLAAAGGLLAATGTSAAEPGGYHIVVEQRVGEDGRPLEAKILSSEDNTAEGILDQLALGLAARMKLEPRLKDGKPVGFVVRAPFVFPVPDDEGSDSDGQPKPTVEYAVQPVYPADLAAQGVVGGAVFELEVGFDGALTSLRCLRSSHAGFAAAAEAALRQWRFHPASGPGGPVASRSRLTFSFACGQHQPSYVWRVPPRPRLGAFQVVHPAPAPTLPEPAK